MEVLKKIQLFTNGWLIYVGLLQNSVIESLKFQVHDKLKISSQRNLGTPKKPPLTHPHFLSSLVFRKKTRQTRIYYCPSLGSIFAAFRWVQKTSFWDGFPNDISPNFFLKFQRSKFFRPKKTEGPFMGM